jgi:hypothetical protein
MAPMLKVNKGDKYNELTILRELQSCVGEQRRFECRCSCGAIIESTLTDLRRGRRKSCGHEFKAPCVRGDKFGSLTVIGVVDQGPKARANAKNLIECRCVCGNKGIYEFTRLKKGERKSCGCLERGKDLDIQKGAKFGRLTILREADPVFYRENNRDKKVRRFECKCSCGNTVTTQLASLRRGTQSCGCLQRETASTHGMYGTPLHTVWSGMLNRCFNKNCDGYHNYGGRGIKVCADWQGANGFQNFYSYCQSLPKGKQWRKGYDIDRIDNNGNYEPGNVHFVTRIDNLRNRRETVWVEVPIELTDKEFESRKAYVRVNAKGIYEMPLMDLWELRGHKDIIYSVAYKRVLRSGWAPIDAVELPPHKATPVNKGDVFGRLTVIGSTTHNKFNQPRYLCECECGRRTKVNTANLRNGKTKSCGCLADEYRQNKAKTIPHNPDGSFAKRRKQKA